MKSNKNCNTVYDPGELDNTYTLSACCGSIEFSNMYQGVSATGWLVRYRNVYAPGGCNVIVGTGSYWAPGTYNVEYWLY